MIKAIIINGALFYSLMGITPSVCNHHPANNEGFSCRSINPQDRSDESAETIA